MTKQTKGKVVSASKQWWLKVNTKPIRKSSSDGAVFPYIIKAAYTADGTEYTARKWIKAGMPVPGIGAEVTVQYDQAKPGKGKVII